MLPAVILIFFGKVADSNTRPTRIRRPTLLINALDDPFVPEVSLPDPQGLPSDVVAEFVPRGGHVGFVEGLPWRSASWAERRAVEFLVGPLTERRTPERVR